MSLFGPLESSKTGTCPLHAHCASYGMSALQRHSLLSHSSGSFRGSFRSPIHWGFLTRAWCALGKLSTLQPQHHFSLRSLPKLACFSFRPLLSSLQANYLLDHSLSSEHPQHLLQHTAGLILIFKTRLWSFNC
ncbi:similar to RIKEN cDNA 1700029M20, isoform CRA_a [Rattus norvegicus]|uniref:Similar to RIKEN cDNA 1700029M20, isoform CRA_a n=1 Tax=Rattus norvegicus TaxID=10116 RepID=A6IT61_RAT|nr:similar to RIKEN cDNA 1700029M20, isoform CRA_a [Rattus norvegicus]EDL80762.1 similar to RIKEN cDNA 1700029M20, isoform CRA_a [Rattus norvegicus]